MLYVSMLFWFHELVMWWGRWQEGKEDNYNVNKCYFVDSVYLKAVQLQLNLY